MKKILIIIQVLLSLTLNSQIEDCGKRNLVSSVESDWSSARGDIENGSGWVFAKVYSFQQGLITSDYSMEIGVVSEYKQDTIYILYPDVIRPSVVEYKGEYNAVYPWSFDYTEVIRRDMCAAIPIPISEANCPDTIWHSFELWYSTEGYARYKLRGSVYSYSNPVDIIESIVEQKIKNKECYTIRSGRNAIAKSNKDIIIRSGYCSDSKINSNDVIIVDRGEILEYKGVKVKGDTIVFSNANFKIRFAKGKVKIQKLEGGGKLEYMSNAKWD